LRANFHFRSRDEHEKRASLDNARGGQVEHQCVVPTLLICIEFAFLFLLAVAELSLVFQGGGWRGPQARAPLSLFNTHSQTLLAFSVCTVVRMFVKVDLGYCI
jgi:hypothetical protein